LRKYKAIFFDWDGTAVASRKAPVDEAVARMAPLLEEGTKLIIVSGTTMENIAGGEIERYFTDNQLQHLYLGLGRGAYNYAFEAGKPVIFSDLIPDKEKLLLIHQISFEIHQELKRCCDFDTDIVFSRPNYCKIDLMVESDRGDNLFMQANELEQLKHSLQAHGIEQGLQGLLDLAIAIGKKHGVCVVPTCDAKYLEVGISSKSDNVDTILEKLQSECGIHPEECAYWGDEFVGIEPGIFGSDSFMRTEKTKQGDFFDVSEVAGERPEGVEHVGGGIKRFLEFLGEQRDVIFEDDRLG
jgi:hydroxymethylpyrimidine pyrophosphatase-like HAD family hydrolase